MNDFSGSCKILLDSGFFVFTITLLDVPQLHGDRCLIESDPSISIEQTSRNPYTKGLQVKKARFGAVIAALLMAGTVQAGPVSEMEPNDSIGSPQIIPGREFTLDANANIDQSTTLPHVTVFGTGNGTFDFFQFTTGRTADIIVDIDDFASPGDSDGTNFDTELFLFDSAGMLLDDNDDSRADAGDIADPFFGTTLNSRITLNNAPAGTYTVAVGAFDSAGSDGGNVSGDRPENGDNYVLHISAEAVVPEPTTMLIFGVGLTGMAGYRMLRRRKTIREVA